MYETLREDILWMRIAPGAAIDEVALAERFAVSRTPIREALLLLQGDWLIDFLPNRTSIVAPLSMNNAGDYFDTHLVLGRTVARAAAASGQAMRDDLLIHHRAFLSAIDGGDYNRALQVTLALMREITALTGNIFLQRYFSHSLDSGIRAKISYYFPNATCEELTQAAALLRRLIDAIASGNPDAGDAAIRELLMQEISISLRSLHPTFGDKMDISRLEATA